MSEARKQRLAEFVSWVRENITGDAGKRFIPSTRPNRLVSSAYNSD
jgi:hypothetical protein